MLLCHCRVSLPLSCCFAMHAAGLALSFCYATHAALSPSYCFASHAVCHSHATLPLLRCLLLPSILATVILFVTVVRFYCCHILLYHLLIYNFILLNAVMLLCHSCCCLATVIVLCRSCCQPFSWYSITVVLYPLLSVHFATVMLRCCCHTPLPLYMLLTAVLLFCHCHSPLPALLTLSFMLFCLYCSAFHCLITFPLSGYFGGIILLC